MAGGDVRREPLGSRSSGGERLSEGIEKLKIEEGHKLEGGTTAVFQWAVGVSGVQVRLGSGSRLSVSSCGGEREGEPKAETEMLEESKDQTQVFLNLLQNLVFFFFFLKRLKM